MEIVTFKSDMQQQVDNFFRKCFAAVGIPYSPKDRHIDIADVDKNYMKNGCFWCLLDNDNIIGTIAIRMLDDVNGVVELKRMFVLQLPKKRYRSCYYTRKGFADWFAEKMLFPLGCVVFAVVVLAILIHFDLIWYMW